MEYTKKFNDNLKSFLQIFNIITLGNEELLETYIDTDLLELIQNIDVEDDSMVKKYFKAITKHAEAVSSRDDFVLSEDIGFFQGIHFSKITENDLTGMVTPRLWDYIQTLYVLAWEWHFQTKVSEGLASPKKYQHITTKHLSDTIDSIKRSKELEKEPIESNEDVEDTEDDKDNLFSKLLSEDSKIGQLAKEIAADVQIDNFENPEKLAADLLQGKIAENESFTKLVKNVSDKLQNKLSSGDLNLEDLANESKNLLGEVGPDGKPNMDKLMKQMAKKMGIPAGPLQNIVKNLSSQMQNGGLNNLDPSSLANMIPGLMGNNRALSTRDRLRKKLEARRQEQQEQSTNLLENQPTIAEQVNVEHMSNQTTEDKLKELETLKRKLQKAKKNKRRKKNK